MLRCASFCTFSMDDSTLDGPSSCLTSSAFFRRLGGRPTGFSSASSAAGRFSARNVLFVDQGHDSPWLQSTTLHAEGAHWVAGSPPSAGFRCSAQTRYRQADEPCAVQVLDDGRLQVAFDRPQRAVTPGQSVVFYDGDACLGGAVILSTNAPAIAGAARSDAA